MIKNHSICDGNLYQIQSSKMNNRQYYKAREKGPKGPRGFSINLPKGGIQAYAKGVKKPRGFLISHQKGESKPMLKGAKEPPGFLVNHLQRGIKTYAKRGQRATWVSSKRPAKWDHKPMPNLSCSAWKTCPARKAKIYYFKGKSAEHLDQTGIRNSKEFRAINP